MRRQATISLPAATRPVAELPAPLPVDELVPGAGPWEVEIGFGKGRYLLSRATAEPGRRFLGIEMAGKYERLFVRRARQRGLTNWLSLHGEALYLAAAVLPGAFAAHLHVYFPDPWPKSRHHKRRLFDVESVDLVLGLLRPGGGFSFATDFLAYGELVRDLLAAHPAVAVEEMPRGWPAGPRTNYEAKYVREGRPILRLEGTVTASAGGEGFPLHPGGAGAVVAAVAAPAAG